jgi:hypothetical protein
MVAVPAARPAATSGLACLAEGAAHRDVVAKQLHLSVNTGVHSMVEAVALTRDDTGWLYEDRSTSSQPKPPMTRDEHC